MPGALIGAVLVGLIRALSLVVYPEFEILAIYLIVIAVLLFRPSGHRSSGCCAPSMTATKASSCC